MTFKILRDSVFKSFSIVIVILSVGCTTTEKGQLIHYDEPLEAEPKTVNYGDVEVSSMSASISDFSPSVPPALKVVISLKEERYKLQTHEKYSAQEITKTTYPPYTISYIKYQWANTDFVTASIFTCIGLIGGPIIDVIAMPICKVGNSFDSDPMYSTYAKTTNTTGKKKNAETYIKKVPVSTGRSYDLSEPVSAIVNGKKFVMKRNTLSLNFRPGWHLTFANKKSIPIKFSFEEKERRLDLSEAYAAYSRYLADKKSYEIKLLEKRLKTHQ